MKALFDDARRFLGRQRRVIDFEEVFVRDLVWQAFAAILFIGVQQQLLGKLKVALGGLVLQAIFGSIALKAHGLRASITQHAANVEGELKRFVSTYVTRELDKPYVVAARTIDVSGAIDKAMATLGPRQPEPDVVAADFDELDGCKAYLAGPPVMVEAATRLFEERGMRRIDIHADAFYDAA